MLRSVSVVGLAISCLALAQTSTVTLYLPGFDTQALVGSVVGIEASLTTYAIGCASSSANDECGLRDSITLTENASTARYTMPGETTDGTLAFTGYADCSLYSTASAVCVESFGGTDANFPGISTETYTGTDLPYMPIVITAGPGSSLTSSVSATPTGSLSSTPTPISSTRASSTRRSSSGGAQATPGTSISTGGVPAVTGHAGWIVGGAAVAVAMAM